MREINVYKCGEIIGTTKVDDEDFDIQNKYKWFKDKDGYIYRRKQKNKVTYRLLLHREVMNCPSNLLIDHWNHDRSDNQKGNLRKCSYASNNHNRVSDKHTSKYKGVFWNKRIGRFQTKIMCKGRNLNLGISFTEDYGAYLYNKKAMELHGEFAFLNIIPPLDKILRDEKKIKAENLKSKTSKYVGVKKQKNRWIAYWKSKYLGSFLTEEDANEAVVKYKEDINK